MSTLRARSIVARPADPPFAGAASSFPAPAWALDFGDSTLLSCRVPDARRLSEDRFVGAITDAYRSIIDRVSASTHGHIVRLWNGVPGIHDRIDAARDRYMLFNAGRFAAMQRWFGRDADLATHAPAASGVGIEGDDFVLHALAMATPGEPIQNPRQTPAAHYSARYGPRPPCFARATRVALAGRPTLIVSGTAAILGEDSMFADDLSHQLTLTIENLAAVVAAAGGSGDESLKAYTSLRVYLPPASDRRIVESALHDATRPACPIEFVAAELCRRELLVEIEGVADLANA